MRSCWISPSLPRSPPSYAVGPRRRPKGNPTPAGPRGPESWSWPGPRAGVLSGKETFATTPPSSTCDHERHAIDAAIDERSRRIATNGLEEAERLRDMAAAGTSISPQVMDSVGVRELYGHLSGTLSLQQAQDLISTRTRRLARRQMRWFDKLARTLEGRASITVLQGTDHREICIICMIYSDI